ncbi:MAG: SURF1 family protein, partial [Caulobacteraceae bacterium]
VQGAPAQAIGPVLARAAAGRDVSFTPVVARCAPEPPSPASLRMTTDHGQWVARVLAPCRLADGSYDGVVVDRGFLASSRGQTNPKTAVLPAPATVWGELFPGPARNAEGLARPAPYVLSAARESPPAPGVDPAPYPVNASNLQYVGAYAPTWFGLAAVLVGIYAAALWRRYHPK